MFYKALFYLLIIFFTPLSHAMYQYNIPYSYNNPNCIIQNRLDEIRKKQKEKYELEQLLLMGAYIKQQSGDNVVINKTEPECEIIPRSKTFTHYLGQTIKIVAHVAIILFIATRPCLFDFEPIDTI